MPLAAEFDIDVELANLGARPVQAIAVGLRANAKEWWVDRFEFRAPGSAHVAITGRLVDPKQWKALAVRSILTFLTRRKDMRRVRMRV